MEKQLNEEKQKSLLQETARAEKYLHDLDAAKEQISKAVQLQSFKEIASQVSHDIRSPLTALNMVASHVNQIPEQQRILIRTTVNRINDIANQLLAKGKHLNAIHPQGQSHDQKSVSLTTELLSPLIESLISEKRIQFRNKQNIEIESDIVMGYGLFANINATEFYRCLSNISNNAIEALPHNNGYFRLTLNSDENSITITAQDNGKGIPKHILDKLGHIGVTYGKDNSFSGNGLGVYHAKNTIEGFGGTFTIHSQEGIGTKVLITLPKAPAPEWFVEYLCLSDQHQVISIDDDFSIHQIWKDRLSSLTCGTKNLEHLRFTSGNDFKTWFHQNKNTSILTKQLFLFDFELLNQKETGLDIIEKLGIKSQSILVTSRFYEDDIRMKCESLGIRMIPKSMAGCVPIQI